MEISYYELLEMIKEGKYPTIKYKNNTYMPDFDSVDGSFIDYQIDKEHKIYNENKFYLVENLLECEMFDKVLTIVDQNTPKEDKKIEKMNFCYEVADEMQNANNERFRDFINEIIDRLNGEQCRRDNQINELLDSYQNAQISLQNQLVKQQQIIDQAIEYLGHSKIMRNAEEAKIVTKIEEDLLSILRGKDNEQ